MALDFLVELFAQHNHVLAVTWQVLLTGIAGVPNARLAHKVEPRVVDDCGLFQLHIRAEEDGGTEDALESADQPAVLGTALLHAESVQHFKGARECYGSALLSDRQGGEEDGDQAILAPGQAIGRMTGDLQQELSVAAFVQQHTIGWPLDRQATKNKGSRGEAETLIGGISLQPHAFNGFQLPKFLLGKRSELRALKYSVSFLKAAGSCRDVRMYIN